MEKLKDKFDQAVWTVERCKGLHVTVRRGRVKCQYAGKSMDSLMVLAFGSLNGKEIKWNSAEMSGSHMQFELGGMRDEPIWCLRYGEGETEERYVRLPDYAEGEMKISLYLEDNEGGYIVFVQFDSTKPDRTLWIDSEHFVRDHYILRTIVQELYRLNEK